MKGGALIRMIPDVANKSVIIADRGYRNYNIIAHIENVNQKYVIRVNDIDSNAWQLGLALLMMNLIIQLL